MTVGSLDKVDLWI